MLNRRILSYFKKYRKDLIYGIGALIFADIFGLMIPWIIKYPIDLLPTAKNGKILLPYIAAILAAATFQSIFRFFWRCYLYGFSRKVEYHLRNEYFSHLQRLSWSFFHRKQIGDIMSRATNDVKAVREFCGMGVLITIDTALTLSISLAVMFLIDIKLTIIALLPLPLVSFGVFKLRKEIRTRFMAVQEKLSEISAMAQENFAGIRVIQAYVQEHNEINRFCGMAGEIVKKNLDSAKISAVFFPALLFAIGSASALALWIGGSEVIKDRITLGSFVAFNGYLAMLTWPMAALGLMVNITQRGMASIERIEEIINIAPDVKDLSNAANVEELKGDIYIKNLKFSYSSCKDCVLDISNLRIKEGEVTAIVGSIGSGKSTFLKLIPRIYDNYSGSISIGGVNIKDVPLNILRKDIGFVEQDPFLFSDTIKENIVFGTQDINKEEIARAAGMAEVAGEINKFPEKEETIIGERGVTLSGGQKQRIAIARAVFKNPKILILDDSFSSLDIITEERILKKLRSDMKKTTIIIVSHRISTIKDADIIIVMNQGKIVEIGKHNELISMNGRYHNLYRLQSFGLD